MSEATAGGTVPSPAPDTRGPLRLLWWVLRTRARLPVTAVVTGTVWMVPVAVLPFAVGGAIDAWTRRESLLPWFATVLVLVLLQAGAGGGLHRVAALTGLHARATVHRVLAAHLTGDGLQARSAPGEVLTIATVDALSVEKLAESLGRAVGSFVGLTVVVTVLVIDAPLLGAVLAVGTLLAVVAIGPLLRPIRDRHEVQRDELGRATAAAVDVIAGLRVLRGVGGEDRFAARFTAISQQVRRTGVHAGRSEARLVAAGVLFPGLVTVAVTWLGARLVVAGSIPVGAVVAAFGASGFLYLAVTNLVTAAEAASVAVVGAGRIRDLLRTPSRTPPAEPDGVSQLDRVLDGIGVLTVVPAGGPQARAFARAVAAGHPGPGRVLLSGPDDRLFSGPVGPELAVTRPDADLTPSLAAAAALDVVHDVLGGPDAHLDAGGRSLSGGQRQRLLLARALHADADVLVLDSPTSAVDAYTESVICPAVARLRRGRTTIVISESAAWAACADRSVAVEPTAEPLPTGGVR